MAKEISNIMIHSRKDPDSTIYEDLVMDTGRKVLGVLTTYDQPELTDAMVYALSAHNFTQKQIADMWSIDRKTLMAYHANAYWKGHLTPRVKRRVRIDRLAREFDAEEKLIPHAALIMKFEEMCARIYDHIDIDTNQEADVSTMSDAELLALAKDLIAKGETK